jgi:hypothetical protein
MTRIAGVFLAVFVAVCAGGEAAWGIDEVLARTPVPNAESPVGEVRLLRRGDATVVQTLLVTRLLARVTGEIRTKEERNWPAGVAGHDDMATYVEALTAAAEQLRASLPAVDARNVADADRRLRLLVELVASPSSAGVEIAEFASVAEERPYDVASRRTLAAPAVGRAYVLRNMRLILADAFQLPESDVDRLGALGPAAAAR